DVYPVTVVSTMTGQSVSPVTVVPTMTGQGPTPPHNKKTASHHTAACCFLNSLCLISIDKRQIPIMTKASRKNMPPMSPGALVRENIYLSAILASSSPIKIIGKAFVCLTYNSEFLTSYYVVIIRTSENTAA